MTCHLNYVKLFLYKIVNRYKTIYHFICKNKAIAIAARPYYKMVAKKIDQETHLYHFTIETNNQIRFVRTAEELSKEKNILFNMNIDDIFNIIYTHASESTLKEINAFMLAKQRQD